MYPRRLTLLLIAALLVAPTLRGHRRFSAGCGCHSIHAALVVHATSSMPRGAGHLSVSHTSWVWSGSKSEDVSSRISGESLPRHVRSPGRRAASIEPLTGASPRRQGLPLRC